MHNNNILKSAVIQFMLIAVNVFTGFIYTPFLLDKIGNEAYAFYPLSFNLINYASIITIVFTSMLSKYITVDYYDNNLTRLNEFFNSSLYGNIIIGAFLCIPMLIGSFFIDKIINVPIYLKYEVIILFIFITLSFFVIQIRNTFMVANISTEKRYLTTLQRVIERALIVLIPIILFLFVKPSVAYLGCAVFAAVLLRFLITVKTQKKIMPQMVVSKKYVKKSVVKALISGGAWHSFTQLITLLSTNVDILLANILFGAYVQSEYSLAVVVPNLVRSMVIYLSNGLLSFLALLFKNENYDELRLNVPKFIKFMSIFMAIISSLIIGFGDVFLSLWIPDFHTHDMYIIMILSSLSIMVTGSYSILYTILVVYDKVKIPAIFMFALGAINVPIAIFISKVLNFKVYGILISSFATSILQYLIFIPYYASKKMKINLKELCTPFLNALYVLAIGVFFCISIKIWFNIDNFIKLTLAGIVSLALLMVIIIFWLIDKNDVSFIIDTVKTKIEYGNDLDELQS